MRRALLKRLYNIFPFDLKGDCSVPSQQNGIRISCIINFYGRLDLLAGILYSLAEQNYPRNLFEIILVEDRGGTAAGKSLADEFAHWITVTYLPLDKNFGRMGYSRNFGVAHSRGEIALFLDDDTVIMQKDFLLRLDKLFIDNPHADAVVPHGNSCYACLEDRYDFHDPYFMTSRCAAYRRSVLTELSGFMSDFVGQEDVEFVIRFMISGKVAIQAPELEYYHPPLLVPNFRKPMAVGNSFYCLKSKYPLVIWLLVILNCARHAPLYLLPIRRYREMGRFGIGFMVGVLVSPFKKEGFRYN